jgi:hypothetical protein
MYLISLWPPFEGGFFEIPEGEFLVSICKVSRPIPGLSEITYP